MEEATPFRKFDVLWELPALPATAQPSFGSWCQAFVRANVTHRQTLLRDLLIPLEAYLALLRSHAPAQWTCSASTEERGQAARDWFMSGQMVPAVMDELGVRAPTADAADAANEHRKMEKYFPRVSRDAVFCIGCASPGHRITTCPLRRCRLCGSQTGDHTLFGCPVIAGGDPSPATTMGVDDTTPPVPASPPKCRFCLKTCVHVDACPLLWRTFVQNPASKRSADEISTACYVCGQDDHFGGDCKDNTGEHISGRPYSRDDDIWTRKYTLQFSDLTKTRRFTGFAVADNGSGPAVVPSKREAKRAKICQTNASSDKANSQQAEASRNGGGSSKGEDKTAKDKTAKDKAAKDKKKATAKNKVKDKARDQAKGKGKGKGKGKAKDKEKPAPGPADAQAVQTNPAEQAGKGTKSRKKRQAKGQQPAVVEAALPTRAAAPKSTTAATAAPATTPATAVTAASPPAPTVQTTSISARLQTKNSSADQGPAMAKPAPPDPNSRGQRKQEGDGTSKNKAKRQDRPRKPRHKKVHKEAVAGKGGSAQGGERGDGAKENSVTS